MGFDGKGAATGAISGASAGMMLGPWGAAVGGVAGGLLGGIFGGTDDYEMTPEERAARQMQMASLNRLEQAAQGKGPSAAGAMVEHNRAENAATQVGYAKTLGGDPALANRMAAEGIARGNAESAYQGQQLRAQEQQAAMALQQNALANFRAQEAGHGQAVNAQAQANAATERQMYGAALNSAGGAIGGYVEAEAAKNAVGGAGAASGAGGSNIPGGSGAYNFTPAGGGRKPDGFGPNGEAYYGSYDGSFF